VLVSDRSLVDKKHTEVHALFAGALIAETVGGLLHLVLDLSAYLEVIRQLTMA